MANISGTADSWALLNYAGRLFTADQESTPLLSLMGGLANAATTNNFEFPTASVYSHEAAAQPAITETASLSFPTAIEIVRTQEKNVAQIFMRGITVSFEALANSGRLNGINTQGAVNNVDDEIAWQETQNQIGIARDINYTFHNGAYQIATGVGVANKTRGMLALAAANTTTAAGGATLSKAIMDTELRAMYAAGARFTNAVIFCNAFQKTKLSEIYGYAPTDRNVGGVNIKQIETDFGNIGIMLDRDMPAATIGIYDIAFIRPVIQPVPGFETFAPMDRDPGGAAVKKLMFGKVGLDHNSGKLCGSITGLATS